MEDVVLHYQPGSAAAGLDSLRETTEKLLEPFPRRTPPVFTPWFPSDADRRRRLPIRPAKPAPVITCTGGLLISHTTRHERQEAQVEGLVHESATTKKSTKDLLLLEDGLCVSETPNHLFPASPCDEPERQISRFSPAKRKDGVTDSSPRKRSWSVFTRRGVLLQSSPSLSKAFHHTVSKHGLHLRQRAKWVIGELNCGGTRDIEQVWRALSRGVRSSSELLGCNANIQREQAEIWVFCDVLRAEQVGRFLKDELQLSGTIVLSVHRRGNVFSL